MRRQWVMEAMSSRRAAEGYSRRLLTEKLGLKSDLRMHVVNPPRGYLSMLKSSTIGVILAKRPQGPLDLIQFFASEREVLERMFPTLKKELTQNGALWISWPKASSLVETDLDENGVREIGLRNGLVDVKVVAVDEVWSALKFVHRRKSRKPIS